MAQQSNPIDMATSSQAAEQETPATDTELAKHRLDEQQSSASKRGGFDWFALSVVILIAAIFAIAGRLYAQPATSLVPVAVLSASGCGLLITALRKFRTSKGVGLLEAALAGLFVVAFQFISALSYPDVVPSLGNEQLAGPGFYSTWGLIAFFSLLFSMIGATLGHLAFAPLRPLPAKKARTLTRPQVEESGNERESLPEIENVGAEFVASTAQADVSFPQDNAHSPQGDAPSSQGEALTSKDDAHSPQGDAPSSQGEMLTSKDDAAAQGAMNCAPTFTPEDRGNRAPQRTIVNYAITVLMLGFVPVLAGYVFAAAFDYALSHNGYAMGPFPTLRLLSSLLPWQIPDPVGPLGPGSASLTVSLLWRIPLFFGNPAPFDAQALEPYVFNAIGLGMLLATSFKLEYSRMPWGKLLILEALLGLAMVLPADLWMMQGLQGVFQFHNIVLPLGTLRLLDPPTFLFNILTGVLICVAIGSIAATRTRRG